MDRPERPWLVMEVVLAYECGCWERIDVEREDHLYKIDLSF